MTCHIPAISYIRTADQFRPPCSAIRIAGEVAQGPQARQEKIRAAADGHELRQAGNALPQIALARTGEITDDRTAWHGFARSEERIAFVDQSRELRVHHPRVLEELKLPRDVGVL